MRAPMALAAFATACRAFALHGVKGLRAALGQNADEIDGDMRIAHRGRDRGRIAHIGLHGVDLTDLAERLQMARQFGPAHRDADAIITLGQRAHDMPADKTRSAENRDQRIDIRGHVSLSQSRSNADAAWAFPKALPIRHRLRAVQARSRKTGDGFAER